MKQVPDVKKKSGLDLRAQAEARLSAQAGPVAEATRRADVIRAGLTDYAAIMDKIAEAYRRQDWKVLGYDSFNAYAGGEFGEARLKLTPEQRAQILPAFLAVGMSKRGAAAALGVDDKTVRNDLRSADNSAPKKRSPQALESAADRDPASADAPPPPADAPQDGGAAGQAVLENHGLSGNPQDSPVDPVGASGRPETNTPAAATPSIEDSGRYERQPGPDHLHSPAGEVPSPTNDGTSATPSDPTGAPGPGDELGGGQPPAVPPPGDPYLTEKARLHAAADMLIDRRGWDVAHDRRYLDLVVDLRDHCDRLIEEAAKATREGL